MRLQRRGRRFEPVTAHSAKVLVGARFRSTPARRESREDRPQSANSPRVSSTVPAPIAEEMSHLSFMLAMASVV